jgi:hypothetical protein
MKNPILVMCAMVISLSLHAQSEETIDSTGLPGDQFSLEGALSLFQKAESPESFEKLLNEQNNQVNNLDLNGDSETDYIRIESRKDGDIHILILQVPVNENENQDVAVIAMEKTGKEEATLQIIGDEALYGEDMIVEPAEVEVENGMDKQRGGPDRIMRKTAQIIVNVWTWPSVRFVYGPAYRPWISPWGWRNYPGWWKPWRPVGWSVWKPARIRYHSPTIRVVHKHRLHKAHSFYKPIRMHSTTVRTRHAGAHANYKIRKTKTTITGPKGRSVSRTKTTVKRSRRG